MYMELVVFQKLTKEISSECFFMTESQQEEKIIQVIDLHHFTKCLDPEIKILDYIQHPINTIQQNGEKKGILFHDMKHSSFIDCNTSEEFKRRHQLSELWFVFVEEGKVAHTTHYTDFIIENSLEIFYDQIFLFQFFQSDIKKLK